MVKVRRYLWNVLIALDQLANTLLAGDPDETISSRLGKMQRKGNKFAKCACRVLDFFDEGHCEKSIEKDRGKPL